MVESDFSLDYFQVLIRFVTFHPVHSVPLINKNSGMLKIWVIGCLICCLCAIDGVAQDRAIWIYGEVTTVMNRKICGYITWGKNLY